MTEKEQLMTVAQLIEELQKLPQDLRVMVKGYERGYYDASTIEIKKVALNVLHEEYYGPHDDNIENHEGAQIIDAVILA